MMPREWTKEQREAQSIKMKAVWARKKLAQMTWWQRVMQAVGLRHGA